MKLPDIRLPRGLEISLWAVLTAFLIPIIVLCFRHAWGFFRLGLLALDGPFSDRAVLGTLFYSSLGSLGFVALAYVLRRVFTLGRQVVQEMRQSQASASMVYGLSMFLWGVIFLQTFSVTWINLRPLQL